MTSVLIVDDSAAFRACVRHVLEAHGFVVVGEAAGAATAVECVGRLRPDIVTLDVRMPGASGLEALRQIMSACPTRVVILSAVGREDSGLLCEATSLGALAALRKPWDLLGDPAAQAELTTTLRLMAEVPVVGRRAPRRALPLPVPSSPARELRAIAIGASAGGPSAVAAVVAALPQDCPPLLIVQHILVEFAAGFAEWLARQTGHPVRLGCDGQPLERGVAFVASPGRHLGVDPAGLLLRLEDGPPVAGFRPSASVLFRSVAEALGGGAACVVLSGMGRDGADGVKTAAGLGALILVQDPSNAGVDGMPRAAIETGARLLVVASPTAIGAVLVARATDSVGRS